MKQFFFGHETLDLVWRPWQPVCMCIYIMFVCMCLYVCMYVCNCLPVCLSVCLSVCVFVCLFVCLLVGWLVGLFVCLLACLLVCLFVCLFVWLVGWLVVFVFNIIIRNMNLYTYWISWQIFAKHSNIKKIISLLQHKYSGSEPPICAACIAGQLGMLTGRGNLARTGSFLQNFNVAHIYVTLCMRILLVYLSYASIFIDKDVRLNFL